MEIIFGKGISAVGSLLDAAVEHNLIAKSGSWYSYGEERIGQGRENVKAFLEANPDIYGSVDRQLRATLFESAQAAAPTQAESGAGSPAAPAGEKAAPPAARTAGPAPAGRSES
jgi:recombination protein RecA